MANFELVLNGFDGSTDKTDDLILWVAVDRKADLEHFIAANNLSQLVEFGDDLPESYTIGDGIDFQLPAHAEQLKARVAELLADYKNGEVAGHCRADRPRV